MDAKDVLTALRRGWWLVLLSALIGAAAMGASSAAQKPTYRATTALYFALSGGRTATDLNQGAVFVQGQMPSFQQLSTMPIVLDNVAQQLHTTPQEIRKALGVTIDPNTVILHLAATTSSPTRSAIIVNTTSEQVVKVVSQVSDKGSDGRAAVQATIVSRATPPTTQYAPNKRKAVELGFLAGLIVGLVLALIRFMVDTRLTSRGAVEEHFPTVPTLGTISRSGNRRLLDHPRARGRHGQVTRLTDDDLPAEEIRALRTNLEFVTRSNSPTVVVTSAHAGEGKTTVCCSLGLALGETGRRVVIVDADLRRPGVARFFGLPAGQGLSDILIGRTELPEVIQRVDDRVDVILSGSAAPNPSELAASADMGSLLDELAEEYDVILIDTPPILPVTDAAILARTTGGALVVVDSARQRRQSVTEAIKRLEAADAPVLGVVLNRVKRRRGDVYVYTSADSSSFATAAHSR